jgi:xanthine dehydrogenase accessory factor
VLFPNHLAVLRGGGDLATGTAVRLLRAGVPVVVLELAEPLAVRRTVSASAAIEAGTVQIEDVNARRADTIDEAIRIARSSAGPGPVLPVVVSPVLPDIERSIIVDARMAKRVGDTTIGDAPLVVGLGPGFAAGVDCDAVVETMRGPRLGRVIWNGAAAPDTGVPGVVGGRSADRVLRARLGGAVAWDVEIADQVVAGRPLGRVGGETIVARVDGVVRGLIPSGMNVEPGTKVGDVDPRGDPNACFEISDKALAVGGGVVEAALVWIGRSGRTR